MLNSNNLNNEKSFKILHWFSEAEYQDNTGEIIIEIDSTI